MVIPGTKNLPSYLREETKRRYTEAGEIKSDYMKRPISEKNKIFPHNIDSPYFENYLYEIDI